MATMRIIPAEKEEKTRHTTHHGRRLRRAPFLDPRDKGFRIGQWIENDPIGGQTPPNKKEKEKDSNRPGG